ncbi:DUF4230 domain-containing protein [Sphingomonas sp. NSE70-1]|uniref:DUF4230 domain-containing protein n=1 Tax=Sphingomonas caseinilyticus TaxID=2908205 RepID=A0ABT0RXI4_9SPHN|nr:DUF4230 domain-containing protein [Sphingomonas caseinilyticus]MCL6699718.1 DUF4230 domain-containing protein [Sphingomonas caseinilyticus]
MEQGQSRLNKTLATAAVIVALVLGLFFGSAIDIGRRLFGGPNPETVASSALQSMRAQNRLVPFVARYVSVVSSRQERLGGLVSSERTLILPGDVRYELDLAKLGPEDVQWDAGKSTLSVTLPEIEIAGPEVDLGAAREYGENGVLSVITDADRALDRNNRARAVADLRKQAGSPVPMRLAREAGRQAVERSFALPLQAAGFDNAKVVARYPTEGSAVTEPLDRSRSYNDVLDEARSN